MKRLVDREIGVEIVTEWANKKFYHLCVIVRMPCANRLRRQPFMPSVWIQLNVDGIFSSIPDIKLNQNTYCKAKDTGQYQLTSNYRYMSTFTRKTLLSQYPLWMNVQIFQIPAVTAISHLWHLDLTYTTRFLPVQCKILHFKHIDSKP
jgi:hypothetical protein